MASQRLLIATLAGEATSATVKLFATWRTEPVADHRLEVDRFCAVRAHGASLPIVYFSEWIDRWLMGDSVLGPGVVEGRRFQTMCITREEAITWSESCDAQCQEQEWLAARLRESVSAWQGLSDQMIVVMVREVLGSSTTDAELQASLGTVPPWLSEFR